MKRYDSIYRYRNDFRYIKTLQRKMLYFRWSELLHKWRKTPATRWRLLPSNSLYIFSVYFRNSSVSVFCLLLILMNY